MKQKTLLSLLIIGIILSVQTAFAQCTPLDSTGCPDPENNGEVCPDSLPGAIAGQTYSTIATILPPPEVLADTAHGIYIPLDHIKLMDVQNLPPGITFQSNTTDSVFMVGTYYCILLSGVPTMAGIYFLKIIVDIYILVGQPVLLAHTTDSTSLSIKVIWDPNGIANPGGNTFHVIANSPNPFTSTTHIGYYSPEEGKVSLAIFDLLGQCFYSEETISTRGEHFFSFDGNQLHEGLYYYSVSNGRTKFTRTMIKTR
jgi:hypothetical protein